MLYLDKKQPRKRDKSLKNGVAIFLAMTKIRRITEFQRTFRFQSPEENFESLYAQFLSSNLGKIYQAIPWKDLVIAFKLKESTKGPTCLFSPRGKLALMFLKHYACCSDVRLIEQLNANCIINSFVTYSLLLKVILITLRLLAIYDASYQVF